MFTHAAALSLSESQKLAIESLVRDGSTPQRVALRGRIILLAQQGLPNYAIAQQLNISRPTVLAMRTAFAERQLAAITGIRKRHRSAKVLTPELEQKIVDTTLKSRPGDGSTHWSVRTLARQLRVSHTMVHRVGSATTFSRIAWNASSFPKIPASKKKCGTSWDSISIHQTAR